MAHLALSVAITRSALSVEGQRALLSDAVDTDAWEAGCCFWQGLDAVIQGYQPLTDAMDVCSADGGQKEGNEEVFGRSHLSASDVRSATSHAETFSLANVHRDYDTFSHFSRLFCGYFRCE